jgi:hypothetical protein
MMRSVALTRVDSAFEGRAYAAYGGNLHGGVPHLALARRTSVAHRTDLVGAALAIAGALVTVGFAAPLTTAESLSFRFRSSRWCRRDQLLLAGQDRGK